MKKTIRTYFYKPQNFNEMGSVSGQTSGQNLPIDTDPRKKIIKKAFRIAQKIRGEI